MAVSVGRLWDILSEKPETDHFKVEIQLGNDQTFRRIVMVRWDSKTKRLVLVVE